MGKSVLRENKTCLNCGYVVGNKFCPNCGQENTDTRKTFHHLFIHFFEDLTHYENVFWKTIICLVYRPAVLTKKYMSGKRLSYLSPIRLYIFISIVAFFLIAIIPNKSNTDDFIEIKADDLIKINPSSKTKNETAEELITDSLKSKELIFQSKKIKELNKSGILNKEETDTLQKVLKNYRENKEEPFLDFGYNSVEEIDSIQKYAPESNKLSSIEYWFIKKIEIVKEKNTKEEILEKFNTSFFNNFSKVLFIYMPIFAFILWLFHDKKRWYYFDHGIFTLHYFSFLILMVLLFFLIDKGFSLLEKTDIIDIIYLTIKIIGYSWMVFYFFIARRRFYEEPHVFSALKSLLLVFINLFFIIIILSVFAFYTFINLH
jgi:hypothetical protein